MKYIGRGWQYTVYDIGDNRVLKKYNTRPQSYSIMLRQCFPYMANPLWKIPRYHREFRDKALYSIKNIKRNAIDMALLGNPKFLNDLDYEQDKAITLGVHFKGLNLEQGKEAIHKFIEFNDVLLANGFIDKSFLIGKNYAVDSNGSIILIDIGELYFDKDRISRQIGIKPWDIAYVTSTIPKQFREYFVEEMNRHFVSYKP